MIELISEPTNWGIAKAALEHQGVQSPIFEKIYEEELVQVYQLDSLRDLRIKGPTVQLVVITRITLGGAIAGTIDAIITSDEIDEVMKVAIEALSLITKILGKGKPEFIIGFKPVSEEESLPNYH